MRTAPPVRTAVDVHSRWFERACEYDWSVGIRARGHNAPAHRVTIMVSEEEIKEAIARSLSDLSDPGDDYYPFDSRDDLYVATGQPLAALVPLGGHVPPVPQVEPPDRQPAIPVEVGECEMARPDLLAAANGIAAEIGRRVAESDFYAPSAIAADAGETHRFLSNCVVRVHPKRSHTVSGGSMISVEVHGVTVCAASATEGTDMFGERLSVAYDDDPERFVNEVELNLAPQGCPSTLLRIREVARLRAERPAPPGVDL